MENFKIKDEYIQLNQLIKAMGWVENGGDANAMIDAGMVKVNGQVEYRKRNKLLPGFVVEFKTFSVKID